MENIEITSSTCAATVVHGRHLFTIANYSLHKGLGVGNFIRSSTFNVDGYDWAIRYYPDGINVRSKKSISVYAELRSENVEVRAQFFFRLNAPQNSSWNCVEVRKVSSSEGEGKNIAGCEKFIGKNILEASEYLKSDRIVIECHITIVKDPVVFQTVMNSPKIMVPPPSDQLSLDFAKLMMSKEGADVTFSVQGEEFPAHRAVLAARSPVFKAQLYGSMMEKEESCITVEDMLPDVFKSLLYFIYTEKLPPLEAFGDDDWKQIFFHLLKAADRYAVERLKLICESNICKNLDVENVTSSFMLADQHQCNNLRDTCLKFMASQETIGKVVASQDYQILKRKSPDLAVNVLECVCKFPKI